MFDLRIKSLIFSPSRLPWNRWEPYFFLSPANVWRRRNPLLIAFRPFEDVTTALIFRWLFSATLGVIEDDFPLAPPSFRKAPLFLCCRSRAPGAPDPSRILVLWWTASLRSGIVVRFCLSPPPAFLPWRRCAASSADRVLFHWLASETSLLFKLVNGAAAGSSPCFACLQ